MRSELGINDGDDTSNAVQWVPDSYWEPSKKFEESMLGDSQQQLEGKHKRDFLYYISDP